MSFSLPAIAFSGFAYLLLLFGVAWVTEKGWIPERITRHRITYILSLGIFASAWAYYGVIDLAFQYGYGALAYYLGTGALFLFAPVALAPLVQLAKRFQIRSLADLMVFRYHSQTVGVLATLVMMLSVLPLIALQLQAVADSLRIMTLHSNNPTDFNTSSFTYRELIAMGYCILIGIFTLLFSTGKDNHHSFIVTMAFEAIVKVVAMLSIGLLALYGVFGGLDELNLWLKQYPEHQELLYRPIHDASSHTLLLVFIASAVAMPHIFHISVIENPVKDTANTLSWSMPLFLLLLALPIFPILWAGFELGVPLPAQYFTIGIPLQMGSPFFSMLAFIGGLSAASGALISLGLSMSTMMLNHWLLPAANLGGDSDLYRQLARFKQLLVVVIFVAGYIFYRVLNNEFSLTDLAIMAFIQALQLLPGVMSVAFWSRANARGLVTGLVMGSGICVIGLLIPTLTNLHTLTIGTWTIPVGLDYWSDITFIALAANLCGFIGISLFTQPSDEERYSAEICAEDELSHPLRMTLDVHSAEEFRLRLIESLGERTASKEVARALMELNLAITERRPYALRRLRTRLEANLSGLMGTTVATEIIDRQIPYRLPETHGGNTDINLIEDRLNRYRDQLTGMAAELNNLRLYHRNTLEQLPMAVCSLGQDREILMWNKAMSTLTNIDSEDVTGSHLDDIPEPWNQLLNDFCLSADDHLHKQPLQIQGKQHWFSLHKAQIHTNNQKSLGDQVVLIEDVTDIHLLEDELLHSERLASVGRLAAGVAHEIGNPVTGIACLAQNLRYETENPEAHETADQILSQTNRITRIVQSLVSFSHAGSHLSQLGEQVILADCAHEAINLLSLQRDKKSVHYINELEPTLQLTGDSQRMIQVFINLLSNARDASPEDSHIFVQGCMTEESLIFWVLDEGTGIPKEHQESVLEPFFTSKEPGEGTGLGLAMVYSIVEEHGGHLQIESPVNLHLNNGTKIIIKIPRQLEIEAKEGNTTPSRG